MHENKISYMIRGAIYEVYNALGPGLLESVYAAALAYELRKQGLDVKQELPIRVIYDDAVMPAIGFRLDMLVENKVIVELKSIERMLNKHHKIVNPYLKFANKKLAILVNFSEANINDGIFRKVNGL